MRSGRSVGTEGKELKARLVLYLSIFVSLDMYFMCRVCTSLHQHVMGMLFRRSSILAHR